MGRRKEYRDHEPTRVDFVKAQVLMTATGYPAHLSIVRDAYGHAQPAPEEGWFWISATPKAAADIRRVGLKAVGKLTTTFIPPQEPVALEPGYKPEDIPAVGSRQFLEEIGLSTEERRERLLERKAFREDHPVS